MADEDKCGICLEPINIRKKIFICPECQKGIHLQCWEEWLKSCGRCIYCGHQVIEKPTNIVSPDYGMYFSYADILDMDNYTSSDDSDYEPAYNLRSFSQSLPEAYQLRPRRE